MSLPSVNFTSIIKVYTLLGNHFFHALSHPHTLTPSQVIVKKSYGDKRKRHRLRNWKLQQIDREMEATNNEEYEKDFTEFLEDLEEDKEYRRHVNIYHG